MAVVRILPASTIFATWRGYVDQALLFIVAKRGGSLVLSNRISVETMCRFFSNDRPLGRSLRFAPLNRIPGFVVSTKVSHNTVQDLLLPWSYQEGSGCVPLGAKEFFLEKLPNDASFPYETFTQAFPPKNPNFAHYNIRINPTNTTDATKKQA